MATKFDVFHDPIRRLLGDEKIEGMWNYGCEMLDSAVRSVWAINEQPVGYSLLTDAGDVVTASNLHKANQVTPDVPLGVVFARICLRAALTMINGEDGAGKIVTRSATEQDWGDRKRSLEMTLTASLRSLDSGGLMDAASWLPVSEEN